MIRSQVSTQQRNSFASSQHKLTNWKICYCYRHVFLLCMCIWIRPGSRAEKPTKVGGEFLTGYFHAWEEAQCVCIAQRAACALCALLCSALLFMDMIYFYCCVYWSSLPSSSSPSLPAQHMKSYYSSWCWKLCTVIVERADGSSFPPRTPPWEGETKFIFIREKCFLSSLAHKSHQCENHDSTTTKQTKTGGLYTPVESRVLLVVVVDAWLRVLMSSKTVRDFRIESSRTAQWEPPYRPLRDAWAAFGVHTQTHVQHTAAAAAACSYRLGKILAVSRTIITNKQQQVLNNLFFFPWRKTEKDLLHPFHPNQQLNNKQQEK